MEQRPCRPTLNSRWNPFEWLSAEEKTAARIVSAKVIQTACRRYLGGMRGHLRTSALVSRRRSNLWRIRRISYSSSWLPVVAYGNHERATSHNNDRDYGLVQRISFPLEQYIYSQYFSSIVLFSEAVHQSFSKDWIKIFIFYRYLLTFMIKILSCVSINLTIILNSFWE